LFYFFFFTFVSEIPTTMKANSNIAAQRPVRPVPCPAQSAPVFLMFNLPPPQKPAQQIVTAHPLLLSYRFPKATVTFLTMSGSRANVLRQFLTMSGNRANVLGQFLTMS
jgi:hypothetical protein